MTAVVATAAAAAVAAASTVAAAAVLMAVALTMMSVTSVNGGSVDDDVSDNSSCGGSDGCGRGTETVMTAAAIAGVKIQQSTSDGCVEGRWWTRARQRVVTNNKSTWPMMRATTKRAARERATVMRVAGEQ